MFKTYLKIALRNLVKEKFFSFINIGGLAVGITVVLIIALYIINEINYDRFHHRAERIYRIAMHLEMGGNIVDLNATFPPLAQAIESGIPDVERAIRVYAQNGKVFKKDDKVFTEDDIVYVSPHFFDVFDFPVLTGDPVRVLEKRNQVLLTPALAKKYFETDDAASVVGESISIDGESFTITGIVQEPPANSHLKFNAVGSIESTSQGRDEEWNNMNVSTYMLLHEYADSNEVTTKLLDVFRKHMPNFDNLPATGVRMWPIVQPLIDIHLRSNIQGEFEPAGSIVTLYIFGTVGFVVLILACVNFINLVTARSANRAKEVGVRKALGSPTHLLMRQFTLESIGVVFIATLLALGLGELLRTPFRELSGKDLPLEVLLTPDYLIVLLLFIVLLGIASGIYPAFFLASFRPAQVLKGKVRAGFKNSNLRNVLVTLQFVISILLIACTLGVQSQLNFMRAKKLGFEKENILVLNNADRLPSQQAFINAIRGLPAVQSTGSALFMPVDDYDGMPLVSDDDRDNRKLVNFSVVDVDFLPALKYDLIEGRNFSRDIPSDSNAVILNERAAEFLLGENPIGKKLYFEKKDFEVIGILRDFNFESLKTEVRPVVFYLGADQRYLHVRLNPGNFAQAIASIEKIWKRQSDDVPFSYTFLDDEYNQLFADEVTLGKLFWIFTVLALFIASLGLLGLAAYMAEQRKKEISIRKVLGATVVNVVMMMSADFARLMVIALILALPFAYYVIVSWLDGFVYKVEPSFFTLLAGGFIVIIAAFVAISFQAIRAALTNPVDSLKEE